MKCGIVGLPNVGKSTLFNALTKAGIAAENYPFCTIEPNVGIVPVPDRRLDVIAEIAQPQKVVPAVVEFVDIAGLVAGASKEKGSATSSSPTSAKPTRLRTSCAASRMPTSSTLQARSTRFGHRNDQHGSRLADLEAVEKQSRSTEKVAQAGGDKEAQRLVAALKKVHAVLAAGRPARTAELAKEERARTATAVSPHHEADHVHRECRRERLASS